MSECHQKPNCVCACAGKVYDHWTDGLTDWLPFIKTRENARRAHLSHLKLFIRIILLQCVFLHYGILQHMRWVKWRHGVCGNDTIVILWVYRDMLNGEGLLCYSNKIEPVSWRKCPDDHWLTNKAYLSAITVTNISQEFYLQDGGKNRLAWIWNKITSLSPYVYNTTHM